MKTMMMNDLVAVAVVEVTIDYLSFLVKTTQEVNPWKTTMVVYGLVVHTVHIVSAFVVEVTIACPSFLQKKTQKTSAYLSW